MSASLPRTARRSRHRPGVGIAVHPLPAIGTAVDTLVIPGGDGVNAAASDRILVDWVRKRSGDARRTASVCTGAFLLAASGAARRPSRRDALGILGRARRALSRGPCRVRSDLRARRNVLDIGRRHRRASISRWRWWRRISAARRRLPSPAISWCFSSVRAGRRNSARCCRCRPPTTGSARCMTGSATTSPTTFRCRRWPKQAGMSERSFSRHYADATGLTPARAIERLRVEGARHLLSGDAAADQAHRANAAASAPRRRCAGSFLRLLHDHAAGLPRQICRLGEAHGGHWPAMRCDAQPFRACACYAHLQRRIGHAAGASS